MTTTLTPLSTRTLGRSGLAVSAIGLGCMGMSEFYGTRDDRRSLATLEQALAQGVTFFDTADMYGPHHNEELLGRALRGRRSAVVIATKCGIVRDPANPLKRGVDNRREYIREACEASLRRLGVDTIDLYYLHRHNPDSAPIEDVASAMAELQREGKIRAYGLSEVSAATLRRAHAVHPVTAVQTEYSLWSRDPETNGVLAACRELGVGFVPYSPLGRGFLSGGIRRFEDFAPDDFRRHLPRFQGDNFARNLALVQTLDRLAAARGCTASQLALAWVLAQGDDVVPIPGTTRAEHLDELVGATRLSLRSGEREQIEQAFPVGAAAGERYYPTMNPYLNR
jgi:aryl-alcohol dehydrogenase-like predicted oxidoreductase